MDVHIPAGLNQLADPYPLLAQIRANGAVCRLQNDDRAASWVITRHAEVMRALGDRRLSSDPAKDTSMRDERLADHVSRKAFARSMFTTDPPTHTRLRQAVTPFLTPERISHLRPFIEATAESLANRFAAGQTDAVDDFAAPLTVLTICRLLGIPAEEHRSILRWSHALMTEQIDEAARRRSSEGWRALAACLAECIAAQKNRPGDGLVGSLLTAPGRVRLADDEILTMTMLMLVAGHETSIGLISNAIRYLLCDQEHAQAVRNNPDAVPTALEEVLRYDGPVTMTVRRIATAEIPLSHDTIHPGDHVFLCLASANRDEHQFPAADRLVVGRRPNPHLAFGHGIHRCPGAALGLLEARIAVSLLIRRTHRMMLSVPADDLRWRQGKLRCLEHLPVHAAMHL